MSVNRIQIKVSDKDKVVTIPIGQSFEEVGREQLIEIYEDAEMQDHVNLPQDYETTRYSHGAHSLFGPASNPDYHTYYSLKFYNMNSTGFAWATDYQNAGFTIDELYKTKSSFINSFFKFDFYDSPFRETQKLMFSTVLPVNNGEKKLEPILSFNLDPIAGQYAIYELGITGYDLHTSDFDLGPTKGKSENYYIQWLKDRELFDMDDFYMGCTFFNAKTGNSMRLLNTDQINIPNTTSTSNVYKPQPEDYYYYLVRLDSSDYTYRMWYYNQGTGAVSPSTSTEFGQSPILPISYYQYVNP